MDKVIEFESVGRPENLRVVERDVPQPKATEIQVDMHTMGLNRAELMYLAGQYLAEPILPSKIGVEGAGVVAAVGSDSAGFEVGDEVCVIPNMNMSEHGVVATRANVPIAAVVAKPSSMSFDDAAAFWMAYATAYGGLLQAGGLTKNSGQVVVVSAASSSVGVAAIQIAKNLGATVIATTRTSSKAAAIGAVGAHHIIATDEEDFPARVMEITNGRGFDIAFDPILGPFLESLATAAAREATLVEYGILSGEPGQLPFFSMIGKALRLTTFHVVFDLLQQPDRFARARKHLVAGYESGVYRPAIDRVFTLEAIADAYGHLSSNGQFGKILVRADGR